MALFQAAERRLGEALTSLAYGNPFTPQRVEAERLVLGEAFVPTGTLLHMDSAQVHESPM